MNVMKKRMLCIICGVVFTLFVGYHLLVCLASGIAPFSYAEARIYMAKAAVLSLLLPTTIYGLFVWVWKLLDKVEHREDIIEQLEEMNKKYRQAMETEHVDDSELVPHLVSAFAQEKKLSEEDKEELLRYLEDL